MGGLVLGPPVFVDPHISIRAAGAGVLEPWRWSRSDGSARSAEPSLAHACRKSVGSRYLGGYLIGVLIFREPTIGVYSWVGDGRYLIGGSLLLGSTPIFVTPKSGFLGWREAVMGHSYGDFEGCLEPCKHRVRGLNAPEPRLFHSRTNEGPLPRPLKCSYGTSSTPNCWGHQSGLPRSPLGFRV